MNRLIKEKMIRRAPGIAALLSAAACTAFLVFSCAAAPDGRPRGEGKNTEIVITNPEILDDDDRTPVPEADSWFEELLASAVLFEDFSDREVEGFRGIDTIKIADGFLRVEHNGPILSVEIPRGFSRAVVCYRVESEGGHLYTPVHTEDGHFALFNDVLGDWAWTDFENGREKIQEKGFGNPEASNRNTWILHEIRVENGRLGYYVNNRPFASVDLDATEKLRNFEVAANAGGRGKIDYIVISDSGGGVEPDSRGKNVAPGLPGGSRYTFGPQEIICAEDYHLEAAVPPGPTASAPFDTAVDPEGYIVMPGSSGTLVRYRDGDFEPLAAPNGHNFECDDRGVFWYYNFPSGEIFRWLPEGGAEDIAELPAAYTDGSIAVAPGGRSVYVARWIRDDDPSKEESALYRYTESRGLEKLLDMPAGELLHAVEVTDDGEVYIATNRGIDRVKGSRRENIYRAPGIHVGSDGLTSDRGGNLYFSAYNRGRVGIFSLDRTGKVGLIAANPPGEPLPFGLSFHEPTNRIICVRKESGELLGVGLDGTIEVLNDPSGLTTPIAVEQHPDGRIFVNGDEAGLLEITAGGRAEGFGGEVTSYQPPPADFAFADDGTLYYSEAAPGFVSRIITIDSAESVSELTRAVGAPAGIDVGPDGRVYYADYSKNAVMELLPDGTSRTVRSGIPAPIGLCVDDEGAVWVGAATMEAAENPDALGGIPNSRILRLDPGGRSERSRDLEEVVGPGDMPEAGFVSGITFFDTDAEGNLYVPAGSKLFMRDPSGGIRIIADGFYAARGAAVLDDGSIAVADYGISALYLLRPK